MKQLTTTFLLYALLSWALTARAEPGFNFNIPKCQKEEAYIVEGDNQSTLTCTGLTDKSNIYWSFTGPSTNGTELRLGECYEGRDSWNCTVFDDSYDIARPAYNFTTLTFVSNLQNIHGGLIKCSQFRNQSGAQAYCAVRKTGNKGPEFHIPECSSGVLEVSENQPVSLTCTGLWPVSNIYWSITGPSNNDFEVRLGNCILCYPNCSATPCEDLASGYNNTRSRFDFTTLEFLLDIRSNDGATVRCSQRNNKTAANCTIRILQGNTTPTTGTKTKSVTTKATETTSTTKVDTTVNTSAFPLALVAGGAGAATLVVIVIVVVVVVVRRSKRKKGPAGSEENVHTSGTERESSYAGLQMSEVGLGSIYSVIDNSNTRSQPETAADNAYVGLRTSDVGLRSVYTSIENSNTSQESQTDVASSTYKTLEMSDDGLRLVYTEPGHTNTDTQSHAAPEGAYAILEMSDNTLTSANTEVDDNENKPANDGGDYEIPS